MYMYVNSHEYATGNKCYKVETFEGDTEAAGAKTWDEAQTICRDGPGVNPDLVSIDSLEENSEKIRNIRSYLVTK